MGLEMVEIVMSVEDRFGIEIPDDDAINLSTIGDLHRYVCGKLGTVEESPVPQLTRVDAARLSPEEILAHIPLMPPKARPVWEALSEILVKENGAPAILMRPETRFVQDLDWG